MSYTLIILDNIYDSIESKIVEEMLYLLFKAKKNGYSSRQTDRFLSICGDDMIGTQIAICRNHDGVMTPISMAKIISSDVFERYNIEHTMISAIRGFCTESYEEKLKNYINQLHKTAGITTYSGGFTINREALSGPQEIEVLKEIYCGIHTLIHQHKRVHTVFGYGSPRLKTDKLFETWGVRKLELDGELPLVAPKAFNFQEYYPMYVKVSDFSLYARQMAKKYMSLWEQRIDTSRDRPIKAA